MTNYQWAISEYEKMEYTQKKIRLIALFEIFQKYSQSIQEMLPLLEHDQIKEDEMIKAYANLSMAIESIEKKDMQTALSKMEKLHFEIQEIRKREKQEREKEDIEAILQNI